MCEGKGLGKVVAAGEATVFVEWCPGAHCRCFVVLASTMQGNSGFQYRTQAANLAL